MLQAHQVQDQLKTLAKEHECSKALKTGFAELLLQGCQEVAVNPPKIAFAMRPSIGVWEYVQISAEDLSITALGIPEYLGFKEQLIGNVFCFVPVRLHYVAAVWSYA